MKTILTLFLSIILGASVQAQSGNMMSFAVNIDDNIAGKISIMSSGDKGRVQSSLNGHAQTFLEDQSTSKRTYLYTTETKERIAIPTDYTDYSFLTNLNFTPTSSEVTEETQNIGGFNCKKVIVHSAEGIDAHVWVTSEISGNYQAFRNLIGTVEGSPVKITIFGSQKLEVIMVNHSAQDLAEARFTVPNGVRTIAAEERTTYMNKIMNE